MNRKGALTSVLVAGVVGLLPPLALAQHGAKGMFYSGEGPAVRADKSEKEASPAATAHVTAPPKPVATQAPRPPAPRKPANREPYMGLSYWVEVVEADGQKRRVTTDHVFRSGDRIRLRVITNRDGYLSLLNLGSTGKSTLLFPHPAIGGGQSLVKANTPYEVPPGALIRFDDNPGVETLFVTLSTKPLDDALVPGPRSFTRDETQQVTAMARHRGAKDLVVEADSASAQPASYAVAPLSSMQGGQMIALEIRLRHE